MTSFDINERTFLPRYMARPPSPPRVVSNEDLMARSSRCYTNEECKIQNKQDWDYEHAWELYYEVPRGGFGPLVKKGWEVRSLHPGRLMEEPPPDHDYVGDQRRHQDQVSRWADGWIAGQGAVGLIWPEDREEVVIEVARRLREVMADAFLLRALEVVSTDG